MFVVVDPGRSILANFAGLTGVALAERDPFDLPTGIAVAMLRAEIVEDWMSALALLAAANETFDLGFVFDTVEIPEDAFAIFMRIRDSLNEYVGLRRSDDGLPVYKRRTPPKMDVGTVAFIKAKALVREWLRLEGKA